MEKELLAGEWRFVVIKIDTGVVDPYGREVCALPGEWIQVRHDGKIGDETKISTNGDYLFDRIIFHSKFSVEQILNSTISKEEFDELVADKVREYRRKLKEELIEGGV